MAYLKYLRKSRKDLEAEARGEGETLSRHDTALNELAQRMQLEIGATYREIVSGDTIAARPQMQKLLIEVESGMWEGVLVMEVERLARGNSIDQGIVSQAFQYSGTRIITPEKVYDPANEFDAEYFEFSLFMSRREYQTIKRRMYNGRVASVKEGKYMGKSDPFGYRRVKLAGEKGWSLEVNPDEAPIIRDIFRWYLDGAGSRTICRRLQAAGSKTHAAIPWSDAAVLNIIRNPLYCGYVTWGRRKTVPVLSAGSVVRKRRLHNADCLRVKARHAPLISEADWNAAQALRTQNAASRTFEKRMIRNPFQGLMHCAQCGHTIRLSIDARKEPRTYRLRCPDASCRNISTDLAEVEEALCVVLRHWLAAYQIEVCQSAAPLAAQKADLLTARTARQAAIGRIDAQLRRACELVEQDVYTPAQFADRQRCLATEAEMQETAIADLDRQLQRIDAAIGRYAAAVPRTIQLMQVYAAAEDAAAENRLLKSVLSQITYEKNGSRRDLGQDTTITLTLFPLVPDAPL